MACAEYRWWKERSIDRTQPSERSERQAYVLSCLNPTLLSPGQWTQDKARLSGIVSETPFCGHNVVRLCNTLAIMAYSRLSKLKNGLHSSWKWLLSFRTNDWQLDDYPVEIREQQDNGNPPLPAPRFISHRYVAHILNAAITGSGDTPSAAKEKLKEGFATVRIDGWKMANT